MPSADPQSPRSSAEPNVGSDELALPAPSPQLSGGSPADKATRRPRPALPVVGPRQEATRRRFRIAAELHLYRVGGAMGTLTPPLLVQAERELPAA
jgi:hypothetical protein